MKKSRSRWLSLIWISVYLIFVSNPRLALAASSVSIIGNTLQFQAGSNEVNTVTVSLSAGLFTVTDSTAPLTAGGGCTAIDPNQVTCADTGVTLLNLNLGDRSDTLVLDTHLDASVNGGSGFFYTDILSVTGTTSNDTFVISATQITRSGGEVITFSDIERLGVDGSGGWVDTYQAYFGNLPLQVNLHDSGGAFPPYLDRLYLYGTPAADTIMAVTNYIGRVTFPPETVSLDGIEWVQVNGGDGDDVLDASASSWPLVLYGDAGNDHLTSSVLGGALYGGDGSDTLTGNTGPDLLTGGVGDDVYVIADRWGLDSLTENAAEGNDSLDFTAVLTDVTVTIQPFGVTDAGGDNLSHSGNSLEQVWLGSGDDLVLFGNNAQLAGGLGTIDGGDGDDTLDYTAYTSGVIVHLGDGSATGTAGVASFRSVRGGSGGDTLSGDDGPNTLAGNAGDDQLTGGAGNDVLDGGSDDDRFLFADDWGQDTLSETIAGGSDTLDFTAVVTDLSVVIAGLDVQAGANLLTHNGDAVEIILGGSGNDVFHFGEATQLASGDGRIDGGGGVNTLDYGTCTSPIVVNLDENATGLSSLANIQNAIGGSGDDELRDNLQMNLLDGGDGNDLFVVGGGDDRLIGSAGDDQYFFAPNWGNDLVIEEVGQGRDTLDIYAANAALTFTLSNTLTVVDALGNQILHPASEVEVLHGGGLSDAFIVASADTGDLELDGRQASDAYWVYFGEWDRYILLADTDGAQDSLFAVGMPSQSDVFTLTAAQVFHKGLETLAYDGIEQLTLDALGGNDEFFVQGWPGGQSWLLAGDGEDVFTVEIGGTGALLADGENGADWYEIGFETMSGTCGAFGIADSGADATKDILRAAATSHDDVMTLTDNQLSWPPTATLDYAGLEGLIVSLGDGDDVITVTSSAETAFTLNGGPHTSGDTLYFDAERQSVTRGDDFLTIPGKLPVVYNEFEGITLFNVLYRLFLPLSVK